MKLSELMKEYRAEHRLSARAFADRIGCTNAYVSLLENDKIKSPSIDIINNIAAAMNMELNSLLVKMDNMNVSLPKNNKINLSISDRLNTYIGYDNLSTVSAATGLSERKLKQWLSGEKEPNMGQVRKLANYLNLKVSDIIGEGYTEPNGVSIPVLGKVIAGIPIEAIEDIIDYEEINAEMAKSGEYFALQISGDSMEPKFSAGDVVIVRKQPTIESGQIAIVRVNGYDATVKKVLINDGGITLVPFNTTAYEPIFYSKKQIQELPVEIAGRVVELRAKF